MVRMTRKRSRGTSPRAHTHPAPLREMGGMCLLLLLPILSTTAPFLQALACPLQKGQCKAQCASLAGWDTRVESRFDVTTLSGDPRLRVFLGRKNRNAATLAHADKAQLFVNYDIYPNIGTGPESGLRLTADTSKAKSLSQCCSLCASTPGCLVYHWYPSRATTLARGSKGTLKEPSGLVRGTTCYLLKGGSSYDMADGVTSPQAASVLEPAQYPASWVGGWSRPIASDMDEPHILDDPGALEAQHEDFHFSGVPAQSPEDVCNKIYTLLSDDRLCINVKLGGCAQAERSSQTVIRKSSGITRGLIKEIGLVWTDDFQMKHTFRMMARAGNIAGLARGYLTGAEFDGQDLPVPLPQNRILSGKNRLTRTGAAEDEPVVDGVEAFELNLEGLVRLRLVLLPVIKHQGSSEQTSVRINVTILDYQEMLNNRGALAHTPGTGAGLVARHLGPESFEVESIFSAPHLATS